LEYEQLHKTRCPNPTLERFQGMDGIYSYKARLVNFLRGGTLPFDRHDWWVNRCGKEVRYIIDYYEVPEKDDQVAYFVDVRPAPTLSGIKDRIHLAIQKWWRGESIW